MYWVTETWTETYWVTKSWYEFWTEYFTLTPMAKPYTPSQGTTESTTWKTDTSQPTTNSEPPTTAPIIPKSQSQDTGRTEPHTTAFNTIESPSKPLDLDLAPHLPDLEPLTNLPTISVKPISSTQTPIAPYHTTIDSHLHDSTKSWTAVATYWVTETWTETYWVTKTWYEFWTEYFTLTPMANPYTPSQGTTESTTWKTDTSQPTTSSEPPTTAPIIPKSQSQDTGRTEPHTTAFNTNFGTIIGQSQPQSTTQPELPTIMFRVTPPTSVGPHWAEAFGGVLPWCWWLFAGFLILCVLSSLTSCFLFLWLLRNYLVVYRRLKRHVSPSRVTLQAYRRTQNTLGLENEAESVSFLPLEQIKDAQAVFRSVLFISRDEQHQSKETEDISSVTELARDKERVFRKTLHRVISVEEEAGGWTEEEERGENARYSLILKEERGLQRERRWLVGEWEMDGGGVACERSCSVIGQPSAVALEWSVVDEIRSRPSVQNFLVLLIDSSQWSNNKKLFSAQNNGIDSLYFTNFATTCRLTAFSGLS